MYMSAEKVTRAFRYIKEKSVSGSKLVFTFMNKVNGEIHFKSESVFIKIWLWLSREVFTWGVSKDKMDDFLTENAFLLV